MLLVSYTDPELSIFEDNEEQEHPPSQDEHQVSDDERISNDLVSGSEHYDSDSDNFIQDDVVKKQLTLFGEGWALTDKPDNTILPTASHIDKKYQNLKTWRTPKSPKYILIGSDQYIMK